jgi:hypothetical protein
MTTNPRIQALIDQKTSDRLALLNQELGDFHDFLTTPAQDVTDLYRSLGVLNPREIEIVSSQTNILLSNLKIGKWTALEVTEAFCKSAAIAGKAVSSDVIS